MKDIAPKGLIRFLPLALCFQVACSSSDSAPGDSDDLGTGGTGEVPEACEPGDEPCLAPPENGFQVGIEGTVIAASSDEQWCEIARLPGNQDDTFYVGSIEAAMTPFSHHLNIRAIVPGSEADENSEVGQRVRCGNNGRVPFGGGFKQLGGSASPYERIAFPDGVGLTLQGGQKVLFNYHYLNTSSEEAPARAKVNFHTVDAGEVEREIRRFGMYNVAIQLPPLSQASFTMECTFQQDVDVFSVTRHTHRYGTDFEVFRKGGAEDGQHVFTSDDWEEGITRVFEEPVRVRAGEGYRFRCDFDNPEDRAIAFGELATDEMCILYGQWAVANPADTPVTQDCLGVVADSTGFVQGVPWTGGPDADQ